MVDETPRRVIWMTAQQRLDLWHLLDEKCQGEPDCPDRDLLCSVLDELARVTQRQRISGRLLANHVSGLRLPHDALPVRVSDEEARALLNLHLVDHHLVRMLRPGPRPHGRR